MQIKTIAGCNVLVEAIQTRTDINYKVEGMGAPVLHLLCKELKLDPSTFDGEEFFIAQSSIEESPNAQNPRVKAILEGLKAASQERLMAKP